uniref:Uncharacterized protein n=1 Tax=Tetradesmus obliquus TaxID=3088 RepID=A0A383VE28_TETOB
MAGLGGLGMAAPAASIAADAGTATAAGTVSCSAAVAGRKRRLPEQQSSVPEALKRREYAPQRCRQCWNLKKQQKSQHFTWASGKRCALPCAACGQPMSEHADGPCPEPAKAPAEITTAAAADVVADAAAADAATESAAAAATHAATESAAAAARAAVHAANI